MAGTRSTAAVLILLPLLLLWPLPASWNSRVLAAPDQEAATHIWGLWAALHEGSPLVVHTRLLAWPEGTEIVLVDPANLPWFALGGLAGPVAGYNTVLYGGLVLAGLAGALLARRTEAPPWLGAVLGMACPPLLANAADGLTEGFGVGWVGIQLALLLRYVETGRHRTGALAALALAAAWYAGPYNGVWAALVDAGACALLGVRRWPFPRLFLLRALGVGLLAALLTSPLAWAVLTRRAPDLPGSAARAGLPEVVDNPAIFRGGVRTGADLLDPWLPGPLTGGQAEVSHTAYLGIAALLLAVMAVARDRKRWPWLAGALGLSVLSLGPHLYLAGRALRWNDAPLLAPAGMLMLLVTPLARLTRWYRAGAAASLLLVPLVASVPRSATTRALVAGLVIADALLLAPLAWPLTATPPPDTAPYAVLDTRNADAPAIVELPPATTAQPPPGRWRDRTGIAQAVHGHPVAGGVMLVPPAAEGRAAKVALEGLSRTGTLSGADRERMLAAGFGWLAIYPEYRPMPSSARVALERCLGPAAAASDEIWIYDLRGNETLPHGVQPPDCPPSAATAPEVGLPGIPER